MRTVLDYILEFRANRSNHIPDIEDNWDSVLEWLESNGFKSVESVLVKDTDRSYSMSRLMSLDMYSGIIRVGHNLIDLQADIRTGRLETISVFRLFKRGERWRLVDFDKLKEILLEK